MTPKTDSIAAFTRRVNQNIVAAQTTIAKFAMVVADTNQSPAHTMAWSHAAFTAAADLAAWKEVRDFLETLKPGGAWAATPDLAFKALYDASIVKFRHDGTWSSSPTQNLMAEETRRAWGRVFDALTIHDLK